MKCELSLASPQTSFGVRLSRIHFSPTGEKWMRDKRTPKDVRGEAKLSQAATKLFAIFFYNILHPVTTVIE